MGLPGEGPHLWPRVFLDAHTAEAQGACTCSLPLFPQPVVSRLRLLFCGPPLPPGSSPPWQFMWATCHPLPTACSVLLVPPLKRNSYGLSPFICMELPPTGHLLFLPELLLSARNPSGLLSRGCQHDLSRRHLYWCGSLTNSGHDLQWLSG